MSSDWAATTIGALCDSGQLLIQTGPFGSQLHAHDYEQEGVAVVPTEAIGRRIIRDDGLPHVGLQTAHRLSRHTLQVGDILFARRGVQATGLSAIVKPWQMGWLCGTGAILLRILGTDIDPEYLSFLLTQDASIEWFKAHAVGAVMPNLNEGVIRNFPLALPSLSEQRAIAGILGALDDKIELNRRMNATLEALARALFTSWFVDFDPVRAKAEGRQPAGMDAATAALFPGGVEQSAIGPIPRGWHVASISDFALLNKGVSYKGEGLSESGMPMINLGCFIGQGQFSDAGLKYYSGELKARHVVRPGDIVLANTDMTQKREVLGSPAIVPSRGNEEYIFTHHVYALRFMPGREQWRRFAYFVLLQPAFRERAEGFATGTTVLALPQDALLSYQFARPPEGLVRRFSDAISPVLALRDAHIDQSRALAAIRDALLPKLLSGAVRVREAETMVEEEVSAPTANSSPHLGAPFPERGLAT